MPGEMLDAMLSIYWKDRNIYSNLHTILGRVAFHVDDHWNNHNGLTSQWPVCMLNWHLRPTGHCRQSKETRDTHWLGNRKCVLACLYFCLFMRSR